MGAYLSQLCSHQVKIPSKSPFFSVNQGRWWFPAMTCPDSGEPVCPSQLNIFSGTGFPWAVFTLPRTLCAKS